MSAALPIRNAAMAASAGTGKTFALSSRYLALLATGADPACIVALTFTRKAAGEILTRILTRLATGAGSDNGFRSLNQQLAEAALPVYANRTAARIALRSLVHALPRLRIGTLDSFFFQILRQFRLEYGIGAELAISEEQGDPLEDLVLQRLLDRTAPTAAERDELLESFKLATYGDEEKSVYASIQRLIQNQYELFQRAPDPRAWGDPVRIWPDGGKLLQYPVAPDWNAIFAALAAQAKTLNTDSARKAWEAFSANLREVQGGGEFAFNATLDKRIYAAFAAPDGDRASVPFGRSSIPLLPNTQTILVQVIGYVRHALLARRIVRTHGLHRLLSAYGREHRLHVALTGLMTFNDISQLLAPTSGLAPPDLHLRMEYRLDNRFLHWLFDEFQDTSLVQWAVIENLLDEVIQDPEGERTLFYVGDTKQAIYEWRSGDPRLFRRILGKYNRPGQPPAIEEATPLVHSWRSSPVVLETVNRVFGSLPDMPLPAVGRLKADWTAIAGNWAAEWMPHEAAEINKALVGHVTLHILPRPGKDEVNPAIVRAAELVAELGQAISSFEHLSVAVLARSNPEGLALLDALNRKGIRAVWAGNSPLLDNALLPAILSLVKVIEHPGDSLARSHVEMSPLAGAVSLVPAELAGWARFIREQGYAGLIARLAARLDLGKAPLESARLHTLMALAADFDRQPNPTALQFISFVQAQSIPAEETGSNIQILTMHKAKGLEYDIVILPALGKDGITSRSKGQLIVHEGDGYSPSPPVDWILSSPETVAADAELPLAKQQAEDRQAKALEELRLLYVAMTRAKRALHLITVAPAKTGESLRLDHVLQNTLAPGSTPDLKAPVLEIGDPQWWRQKTSPAMEVPAGPSLVFDKLPQVPAGRPLEAHLASREHAGGEGSAGRFFRAESAEARDLGTSVHALFEQIEWLLPGEIPAFAGADAQARRLVTEFLKEPGRHQSFERPAGNVELLREQSFEAILGNKWLSGKMDRVHLEKDAHGRPVRARIMDYKTDQVPDPERHRPQLDIYRQAVALLFALPPRQIACTVLFVRAGQALDI